MNDLASKIEEVLRVKPSAEQLADIDAVAVYASRVIHPASQPKIKEEFLKQLQGYIDKSIKSIESAQKELDEDFDILKACFYVGDIDRNESMRFEEYAVDICSITGEAKRLTKDKESECFNYFIQNLNTFSASIDLVMNGIKSKKKKGNKIDQELYWFIEQLACIFSRITNTVPRRSFHYINGESGLFLEFTLIVLESYGIKTNNSVPNIVRKVLESRMA